MTDESQLLMPTEQTSLLRSEQAPSLSIIAGEEGAGVVSDDDNNNDDSTTRTTSLMVDPLSTFSSPSHNIRMSSRFFDLLDDEDYDADNDDDDGDERPSAMANVSNSMPGAVTTIHNDPDLFDHLHGTRLVGSTRMMILYQRQKKKKRQQQQEEERRTKKEQETLMQETVTRMKEHVAEKKENRRLQMARRSSSKTYHQLMNHVRTSFFDDAKSLAEGTIPQSILLALVIGTLCGIVSFGYYTAMEFLLESLWRTLPEQRIEDGTWPEAWHVLWIPLLVVTKAICVGLAVRFLGEPGDLAFTISMIHHQAYIPMDHVLPMATASLFSIVGGASLGPEAPLVAICGALGGYVSRHIFGQQTRNVIRKHSLMGMASALAVFFGVPLGGSLFALEVHSRFGVEYFEQLVESIFCGEVSLVVFRLLSRLPIAPIWNLSPTKLVEANPVDVLVGGAIGLMGALVAYIFTMFHAKVMAIMGHWGLLDNRRAVARALVGAVVLATLGMLIPATLFWGEMEFPIIATSGPSSDLPHVWPTSGLLDFEMDTAWKGLLVGFAKVVAISFSVAGGMRGGFIFPFFSAGAAFGAVIDRVVPGIPIQLATLCMAAGINVVITRTSLATTLILSFLSGEPCAIPAILCASLVSLFATSYMTFMKTQIARSDIDHSLYHREYASAIVPDNINSDAHHV